MTDTGRVDVTMTIHEAKMVRDLLRHEAHALRLLADYHRPDPKQAEAVAKLEEAETLRRSAAARIHAGLVLADPRQEWDENQLRAAFGDR
jgi:hypothetical protein